MSKTKAVADAWEDDWETAADVRTLRLVANGKTDQLNRSYSRLRQSPSVSRRRFPPKSPKHSVEPRHWNLTASYGLKRIALHSNPVDVSQA